MCGEDRCASTPCPSCEAAAAAAATTTTEAVGTPPLYYALCPQGVEDVVRSELERIAPPTEIVWRSSLPSKQLPQGVGGHRTGSVHTSLADHAGEKPLRGALFFTLRSAHSHELSASIEETECFLERARRVRAVEFLALHLLSCPCVDTLDSVVEPLRQAREKIHAAVIQHLSALRSATGRHTHMLAGYDGSWFSTPLTDSTVMFRVNCVRRDSGAACPFTSQELAARVGEVLFDAFQPLGWRVNMLYYNVEFFALHDVDRVCVGVVLTPPALPRCGKETRFTVQLGMELLRQRIGDQLLRGECANTEVKAAVPRPSAIRHDVRAVRGQRAMSPALAWALCRYADVRPGMIVVDPFVGSGTLLLEAWVTAGFGSLVVLGGDVSDDEAARSMRNLQSDALFLAAVHGLLSSPRPEWEGGETATLCRALLQALKSNVDVMPLPCAHEPVDVLSRVTSVEAESVVSVLRERLSYHYEMVGQTLRWDATRLPLRSNSVDRIISDLPFGMRCGNHKHNVKLYPMMLRECHRVLRRGHTAEGLQDGLHQPHCTPVHEQCERWWETQDAGIDGRAVLLTIEAKLMMESLQAIMHVCPFRLLHPPFVVDMGGLSPYVFVLKKE
ncbi:putative THUMP domain-containing protein 3-like [Trypanosoma grayi]|uniref:putative THUMP domain-containing protein 3-like n=1 Tax=Trypanosoma grayi TaxID=71804 RepID=UPI0004F47534|nr:putative THUMP domain-containing protein 3-like [Trypanosoma grayi]KEG09626.1 putative THUMP domain-containing protein 3-like [Trypanosoma grayi]